MLFTSFVLVLMAAVDVEARPTVLRRQSVTDLSAAQIAEWTTPAYLAQAAYCPSYTISGWDCGIACQNVPELGSIVTGGDGADTPRWFVGTQGSTVVVSISGTNTSSDASIAVDVDFPLVDVDGSMFPSSSGVQLHQGFYGAFQRMQPGILSAVQTDIAAGANSVLVVGHSLGAALCQIMATYLQKQLSVGVTSKAFAPPRSGNVAWADYVDATLGGNTGHMINFNDDVPHLPPRDWGYEHNSGEIWILQDGTTYEACSGQENPDCSDSLASGAKELELVASFADDFDEPVHHGPYAGVLITGANCVTGS